jgi:hypothetical protein
MNLMESLMRRLQGITNVKGNHIKYYFEGSTSNGHFSGPKSYNTEKV